MSRFYEVTNTEIINLDEIAFVEFTEEEGTKREHTKKVKIGFRGDCSTWWFYLTSAERSKLRVALTGGNKIC